MIQAANITWLKESGIPGGYYVNTMAHYCDPSDSAFVAEVEKAIAAGVAVETLITASEQRQRLQAYINTKRQRVLNGGVHWSVYTVQSDPGSREALATEAISAMNGWRQDGEVWRMLDNTNVPLTNTELLDMARVVRNHGKHTYSLSWYLKQEVEAGTVTTEAEIDAAGWPQ